MFQNDEDAMERLRKKTRLEDIISACKSWMQVKVKPAGNDDIDWDSLV